MKSIVSMMLLGLGFASASVASEPFTIEYKFYSAYTKNACPMEITQLVDSKDHLKLIFETKQSDSVLLSGSATPGLTTPEQAKLSKEDHNKMLTYMLDNNTKLQVGDEQYPVKQLWIESASENGPWDSAFYLGDNTSCLIMASKLAETNTLSQPRG